MSRPPAYDYPGTFQQNARQVKVARCSVARGRRCSGFVCWPPAYKPTWRHVRTKRSRQRSYRLRAVQERDLLDRRRDGAHRLPHDLFGRAEGQHGLLDGLRRRRRQAGGAGPHFAGPSRLGADRARIDHAPLRRQHESGRRLHHERPVRRRHAPARHLRLQAALSRRQAPGLRRDRLPPHRCRRPGRRLQRVGLHRDLRRGPAHRAAEALRRGQAQRHDHDLHRAERAPAGEGVRRPARPARRLPHRRTAVRRAGFQAWARSRRPPSCARPSTMPSA